ncbi:hypothetical protein AB1L88_20605 [Tautonia sp. JC769]|uniref:hypothetical protein n=1 Tax=Tautonia sp. JC769 TaxID=3232135 RepID=UPI0034578F6E
MPADGGARIPDSEVAHLVEAGVLPDVEALDAERIVDWLLAEKGRCRRELLADAFVVGVVGGRYDYRSALGSYASFFALDESNREAIVSGGMAGLPGVGTIDLRHLVRLGHRRLWKPYVYHDRADYAAFDLSRFRLNAGAIPEPSESERANFRALLDAIRGLPGHARLTDLQKCATGWVKGDKYDRQHVLEILGYCDILGGRGHEPMRGRFVDQMNRPLPARGSAREWRFPACFWDGESGVNEEAVAFWFPGYEV